MKRLINADKLKKAIETYDKFACLPDTKLIPFRMLNEPEKDYEPYVHLRDMQNAIDSAPTVDFIISPDYVTELQNINKALRQLEEEKRAQGESRMVYVQETVNTILNSCTGNTDIDKAFRNAARLVQNAIDGEPVDFEEIKRRNEE